MCATPAKLINPHTTNTTTPLQPPSPSPLSPLITSSSLPASVAAPSGAEARQVTIFHAAAAGDLELVKFYISGTHGQCPVKSIRSSATRDCSAAGLPVTDINSVDDDGMTPLHHAAA